MDIENNKRIWVCVETLKANNSVTLRGSMLESDFNKIIAGKFENKFVEIADIHWVTNVMINNRNGIKFMAYGKDGEWKWHTGISYFIVDRIINIAVLKDMTSLVESEFQLIYESK
jgi:hypothetical protein